MVHATDFEHSATSQSDEGHSLIENQRPVIALRFDFFDVIYFASKKDVEVSELSRRLALYVKTLFPMNILSYLCNYFCILYYIY